jgi:hypothetical protein
MEKEVFHSVSYGVSESEKVKMHIQCSYTFLLQLMDYIPLGFPLFFQDVQLHHFADVHLRYSSLLLLHLPPATAVHVLFLVTCDNNCLSILAVAFK